jgi:hypothetical protein
MLGHSKKGLVGFTGELVEGLTWFAPPSGKKRSSAGRSQDKGFFPLADLLRTTSLLLMARKTAQDVMLFYVARKHGQISIHESSHVTDLSPEFLFIGEC